MAYVIEIQSECHMVPLKGLSRCLNKMGELPRDYYYYTEMKISVNHLIIFAVTPLIAWFKKHQKTVKNLSQFPRAQGYIFKCLVLFTNSLKLKDMQFTIIKQKSSKFRVPI